MLLVLRLLPCQSIHILQDRLVATRFNAKENTSSMYFSGETESEHTHTHTTWIATLAIVWGLAFLFFQLQREQHTGSYGTY